MMHGAKELFLRITSSIKNVKDIRMRLRCCLGVAYFLAKSEPVLLIKVLLIKKACNKLYVETVP